MKSFYEKPISIHPAFLKRITKVRQNCGEEAASLFIQAVQNLKEKLSLVKSEIDLENLIEELGLENTIVFPQRYKDNGGCRSDSLFFEMPLCQAQDGYYYGRILLCFPYFFKKNELIDELRMFCEMVEEKLNDINNVEIYGATYRG